MAEPDGEKPVAANDAEPAYLKAARLAEDAVAEAVRNTASTIRKPTQEN